MNFHYTDEQLETLKTDPNALAQHIEDSFGFVLQKLHQNGWMPPKEQLLKIGSAYALGFLLDHYELTRSERIELTRWLKDDKSTSHLQVPMSTDEQVQALKSGQMVRAKSVIEPQTFLNYLPQWKRLLSQNEYAVKELLAQSAKKWAPSTFEQLTDAQLEEHAYVLDEISEQKLKTNPVLKATWERLLRYKMQHDVGLNLSQMRCVQLDENNADILEYFLNNNRRSLLGVSWDDINKIPGASALISDKQFIEKYNATDFSGFNNNQLIGALKPVIQNTWLNIMGGRHWRMEKIQQALPEIQQRCSQLGIAFDLNEKGTSSVYPLIHGEQYMSRWRNHKPIDDWEDVALIEMELDVFESLVDESFIQKLAENRLNIGHNSSTRENEAYLNRNLHVQTQLLNYCAKHPERMLAWYGFDALSNCFSALETRRANYPQELKERYIQSMGKAIEALLPWVMPTLSQLNTSVGEHQYQNDHLQSYAGVLDLKGGWRSSNWLNEATIAPVCQYVQQHQDANGLLIILHAFNQMKDARHYDGSSHERKARQCLAANVVWLYENTDKKVFETVCKWVGLDVKDVKSGVKELNSLSEEQRAQVLMHSQSHSTSVMDPKTVVLGQSLMALDYEHLLETRTEFEQYTQALNALDRARYRADYSANEYAKAVQKIMRFMFESDPDWLKKMQKLPIWKTDSQKVLGREVLYHWMRAKDEKLQKAYERYVQVHFDLLMQDEQWVQAQKQSATWSRLIPNDAREQERTFFTTLNQSLDWMVQRDALVQERQEKQVQWDAYEYLKRLANPQEYRYSDSMYKTDQMQQSQVDWIQKVCAIKGKNTAAPAKALLASAQVKQVSSWVQSVKEREKQHEEAEKKLDAQFDSIGSDGLHKNIQKALQLGLYDALCAASEPCSLIGKVLVESLNSMPYEKLCEVLQKHASVRAFCRASVGYNKECPIKLKAPNKEGYEYLMHVLLTDVGLYSESGVGGLSGDASAARPQALQEKLKALVPVSEKDRWCISVFKEQKERYPAHKVSALLHPEVHSCLAYQDLLYQYTPIDVVNVYTCKYYGRDSDKEQTPLEQRKIDSVHPIVPWTDEQVLDIYQKLDAHGVYFADKDVNGSPSEWLQYNYAGSEERFLGFLQKAYEHPKLYVQMVQYHMLRNWVQWSSSWKKEPNPPGTYESSDEAVMHYVLKHFDIPRCIEGVRQHLIDYNHAHGLIKPGDVHYATGVAARLSDPKVGEYYPDKAVSRVIQNLVWASTFDRQESGSDSKYFSAWSSEHTLSLAKVLHEHAPAFFMSLHVLGSAIPLPERYADYLKTAPYDPGLMEKIFLPKGLSAEYGSSLDGRFGQYFEQYVKALALHCLEHKDAQGLELVHFLHEQKRFLEEHINYDARPKNFELLGSNYMDFLDQYKEWRPLYKSVQETIEISRHLEPAVPALEQRREKIKQLRL